VSDRSVEKRSLHVCARSRARRAHVMFQLNQQLMRMHCCTTSIVCPCAHKSPGIALYHAHPLHYLVNLLPIYWHAHNYAICSSSLPRSQLRHCSTFLKHPATLTTTSLFNLPQASCHAHNYPILQPSSSILQRSQLPHILYLPLSVLPRSQLRHVFNLLQVFCHAWRG
jgi:hypothetical protein